MRSKGESRMILRITRELIAESVPQNPESCTLANAAHNLGIADVRFSYDVTTGDVVAAWDAIESETGRVRHHTAVAEPTKRAVQILVATDIDKGRLLQICPPDGWEVELANHESRYKQTWSGAINPPKTGLSTRRKPRRTESRMRIAAATL